MYLCAKSKFKRALGVFSCVFDKFIQGRLSELVNDNDFSERQ